MRPFFLLIYTAAKGEKKECGREIRLVDTAANREKKKCGRIFNFPIRPQIEKDRAAAVRCASLRSHDTAANRKRQSCGRAPRLGFAGEKKEIKETI